MSGLFASRATCDEKGNGQNLEVLHACVSDSFYAVYRNLKNLTTGSNKEGVCDIAYASIAAVIDSSAPLPGEQGSRSPQTEAAYLKRALWFAQKTASSLGIEDPSPMEVVTHALDRRPEWSRSTWRQMKSSLLFRYDSMGTVASLEACRVLREQGDQAPCLPTSLRTSGLRAKTVQNESLESLIRKIRASSSAYSAMLESWMIMGALCGLRPHEWTQAQVIWAPASQIDPQGVGLKQKGQFDLERPYLRVENSKATNGRGLGAHRHLDLSAMTPVLLGAVTRFCDAMRRLKDNGEYQAAYLASQRLLWRINSAANLDTQRKANWIQIYSPRHIYSSRAKLLMPPEQVSATMGHSTDRTAITHYGRKTNEGGAVGIIPVQTEVAKVRTKRKIYAEQVAAAKAKSATAGAATSGSTGEG